MISSRPSMTAASAVPRHAPLLALAAAVLLAPGSAPAYSKAFSAGALIIPAQMEYQTDCGMTSAYGLVYTLLYKNAELQKAGKKPITVYWIIDPRKLSHHRCDTSTDALPDYSRFNDNDGCDLAIQSAAGQPVALLQTDNTDLAPFSVFSTTYDKQKGSSTRNSPTPNIEIGSKKKVVKYSGSFWVIDAIDRAQVLDLFRNDSLVMKFRDGGKCASIPVATAGSHHTVVHSARAGFTAPVARIMNVKPSLIALLNAGAVTILQAYLKNAGLADLPNAGGTPSSHGVIYDILDPVTDFVSTPTYSLGALNMPDPADETRSFYQVLWAPHWVSETQSTLPGEGDPGDQQPGDGKWTHLDPASGTYDDPITNALRNIGAFADAGNGVFAECASIESFEGSYNQGTPGCSGVYECQCSDATQCLVGDKQPLGCGAGYTNACGNCYACDAGYTLKSDVCNEVRCVSTASPCPAGYQFSCGTCNTCPSGWTLDTSRCPSQPAVCRNGTNASAPNTAPLNTGTLTTQALACGFPGYSKTCVPSAGSIDIEGNDATRFQVTNRLQKNGLGNSFAGPDCTDDEVVGAKYKTGLLTGDCLDFHPKTGGPANIFSQKGNFNYTGTSGHIHQYLPPPNVGSYYRPGVLHFATSRNASSPDRDGWDFTTARHKDNDPAKGMVVYLAGHSYANDVAGNRIVLNTMLNLGFSDAGVEIARSEPVGYVTRRYESDGTPVVLAETVFQGTYIQKAPPGPFQDWINYNGAVPRSWRFPYIDGHLRAYDLNAISRTKQEFRANALWDAAARMPRPADRRIYTALGGRGRVGWKKVEFGHAQTDPSLNCLSSRLDAAGKPICDLSWELAACNTAGVTQGQLSTGDPFEAAKRTLGMFVQQVRGHCSAHNRLTGEPIYVPIDSQCDDLKQQKNRAKLGGIDHSSPAIIGPSRFIPDEVRGNTTIRWSRRPVFAYAGGRDGALHAFYVSGETSWTAEGASMPTGVVPGHEVWAFIPPGQLCGLHTNSAMVDGNINVVDAFDKFPQDANGDGNIDWTDARERPNGIRTWRTILVASVGEGGSELFALDVTNPLKPVLLWHVSGPRDRDDAWFDAKASAWKTMDKRNPLSYASTWFNWDDGVAMTSHIPTAYNTTSQTVLDAIKSGRYDYRNMGLSFGTGVDKLWEGDAFRYVVWTTTSSADWTDPFTPLGFKGLEVFALDLVTGEKLWQWQNRYTRKNPAGNVIADNATPGRPALVDTDADGAIDRVYAGDIEGHMWELAAADGKNHNFLKDASGKYVSLPLFGTPELKGAGADAAIVNDFTVAGSVTLAQQPLTSPIGTGRMLKVPASLEKYLKDRIAVAQGTMGVDWSIAPFEPGHVFVLPAYPEKMVVAYRNPVTLQTVVETVDTRERDIDLAAKPWLALKGVLLAAADWDIDLAVGERVFGIPKIVGNDVLVNTSYGGFSGDIADTYLDAGSTLRISAAGGTEKLETIGKAFGGVLVMDKSLVVTSASGMVRHQPTREVTSTTATSPRNRYTPTNFTTWEQPPREPLQ